MNSDQGATFFWHDYESFGLNPRCDRPAQFAGIRTDFDLNPVGEPISLYCRLSDDYLPDPDACLITGIGPDTVERLGLPEPEFVARLHAELSRPQTCGVGYNTLRFDDEMTRHLLWRNLYEPYAREFRNGCSRWDILDLVRAAYAFRPEGIVWPRRDDGQVSFKLEHLTAANGIAHGRAHDALSDVEATIALARLIKARQPRLFDFCLRLRQRQAVLDELSPLDGRPFLHVSGMYPAARGCMAVVAPLGWHPSNRNELAVWDLAHDPAELFDLDAEALRRRLFSRGEELAQHGETRLPIKTIHLNRSPVVVGSLRALFPARAAELGIDLERALIYAERLKQGPKLDAALSAAYARQEPSPPRDVDGALYDGFINDRDRRSLDRLRQLDPEHLCAERVSFDDPRLEELLFRYCARNWPQWLEAEARQRWQAHRADRLLDGSAGALTLAGLREKLAGLRERPDFAQTALLDELARYGARLAATLESERADSTRHHLEISEDAMKPIYRLTLAAGLIVLGAQVRAEEAALAQSFDEALVRAVMQDQDQSSSAYRGDTLRPPLHAAVARAVEACTSKVKRDHHRRLRFAAALGIDGSIAKVWSDADPITASCLSQQLLKTQLPQPPKAPYYIQMEMSLDPTKRLKELTAQP